MKLDSSTMLFRDIEMEPTQNNLQTLLNKKVFTTYSAVFELSAVEFGLTLEWRYYKDGKAWLCKAVHKKKTIFWLSLWDKYVTTSFYFTAKTGLAIADLQIDVAIKEQFAKAEPSGKLIPLVLKISQKNELKDLKEIIQYKLSLK